MCLLLLCNVNLFGSNASGTSCKEYETALDMGTYSALKFSIKFERLDTFYTRVLLWPNFALLSLSSLMFFLPKETADRPGFGMTLLLTLSVNMMIITDYIPETSRHFPRACNFFLGSLMLCAIGVVLVCIMDRLESIVDDTSGYKSDSEFPLKELNNGKIDETGDVVQENGKTVQKQRTNMTFARFPKKLLLLYAKFQRFLKKNELVVGFVYFLTTIVAHLWSFLGSYFYQS